MIPARRSASHLWVSLRSVLAVVLQPVLFSKEVVGTIKDNFKLFDGVGTPGPRLLHVERTALPPGLGPQPFVLSTKS